MSRPVMLRAAAWTSAISILGALLRVSGAAADVSKPDLLSMLNKAGENYKTVRDYSTVFHKRQRVGGYLYEEEKILLKFKKPFMVYMKWIGGADNGREALYVKGRYDGRMLVHLGGMINYLAPSFLINPQGVLAMRRNLRPISESGLGNTIQLLAEVCDKARACGDLEVRYAGRGEIGGRPTQKFERLLPPGKGYPAHRTLLELDAETGYPLSVISYGWNGELLEKYLYNDLRVNIGLADGDFDRKNTDYSFGRITVPIP